MTAICPGAVRAAFRRPVRQKGPGHRHRGAVVLVSTAASHARAQHARRLQCAVRPRVRRAGADGADVIATVLDTALTTSPGTYGATTAHLTGGDGGGRAVPRDDGHRQSGRLRIHPPGRGPGPGNGPGQGAHHGHPAAEPGRPLVTGRPGRRPDPDQLGHWAHRARGRWCFFSGMAFFNSQGLALGPGTQLDMRDVRHDQLPEF